VDISYSSVSIKAYLVTREKRCRENAKGENDQGENAQGEKLRLIFNLRHCADICACI
jgi:hypothetical protein